MLSVVVLFAVLSCVLARDVESRVYANGKPSLRVGHELPEVSMNVSQMITYNGYPVENHDVTTDDGYILTIQHIPYGRNGKCKDVPSKPVIFLQHGLLCSSTNWVANLPNESFAFIAADRCFDVWLGNVRGNTYGKRHVKLPVNSDAFWDFSFDEMAKYDLPAMINYVTKATGQPSLYYVGHSQGTMIGFVEFGRNPALVTKVKAFFALAPVTTVTYMEGALKYLSYIAPELQFLFKILGVRDFLPSDELMRYLGDIICGHHIIRDACSDILFLIAGVDTGQLNEGTPPEYNVSAVAVPSALYWGGKDILADPRDVKSLMSKLPHQMYNKYIPTWSHLDFIWAMDAATEVYDDVINHIRSKEMEDIS